MTKSIYILLLLIITNFVILEFVYASETPKNMTWKRVKTSSVAIKKDYSNYYNKPKVHKGLAKKRQMQEKQILSDLNQQQEITDRQKELEMNVVCRRFYIARRQRSFYNLERTVFKRVVTPRNVYSFKDFKYYCINYYKNNRIPSPEL